MSNKYEQRFFSALKDTFVGHKIKGKSGYVNLLDLKQQFFSQIEPFIKKEIDETIDEPAREELYEKLYSFFDSYLNETGTVFFANSQLHKNLYERVYSDRDDVSLFWKTQKLYYVKSEAMYDDLETEITGITYVFDASDIKHAKGNEKKSLVFYLVDVQAKKLTFKVRYQEQTKYDRLKEYLEIEKPNDIKDHLIDNYDNPIYGNVNVIKNNIDRNIFTKKGDLRDCIYCNNEDDALNTVSVEFSPSKIELIHQYCNTKSVICTEEEIKKAFHIYKKQNEVDYFIHKDAESFLKEQFDIYTYNWLFNDLKTDFDAPTVTRFQNIKKIAHRVIEYIARFEDELKAIWEKPKFVKGSNYVISMKDLKSKLNEKDFQEITKYLKECITRNDKCRNDIISTLKDIYKLPLQKKYIPDFNFDGKSFEGFYIKFIDPTKQDLKKLKSQQKVFNGIVFDREKELEGDFEILSDKKIIPIEDLYIDTIYLENNVKYQILEIINKSFSIDLSLSGVLVKSDNFQTLNTLSSKYANEIALIYIDPPFNTESQDFAYKDKYKDSTWLSMVSNRLDFHNVLLKNDSSEYIHLDANCNFLMRSLLSNLYNKNLQREIIWNTSPSPSGFKSKANNFIRQHDTIFYLKNGNAPFNKMWVSKNSIAQEIGWLDFHIDENDKAFILKRNADGEFEKVYIKSEFTKLAIGDVWNDVYSMMFTQNMTRENWSEGNTQKPENLLRRILQSSTNENDWVMDYFVGSGTTAVAAHKLSRKWLCSDIGEYIYSTVIPRLKTVLVGDIKPKLTEDTGWNGGGIFKYFELEQYEDVLAKATYQWKEKDSNVEQYSFMQDQKLLDALEIDYEKKNVKVVFERLYQDVDIAETLSNLSGKPIKELAENYCVLVDRETEEELKIVYDEMTFEEYPWIKPLIWWHSK